MNLSENVSENEKTTVQAASASRMDMRHARNQLVFLSAQFLLGMAVDRRPRALPAVAPPEPSFSERGSGHSGRHRTASHPDR